MGINLMTLLLQAIGFGIFILFTVKFVLPPLATAIETRRRQIADGLAEAEKGKASLATAQKEVDKLIAEAKAKGYEGEMCSECGNFTLVRNGTCMKCDTCGSTTGCS